MITPPCFLCFLLGVVTMLFVTLVALWLFLRLALPYYAREITKVFKCDVLENLKPDDHDRNNQPH